MNMSPELRAELQLHFRQRQAARAIRTTSPQAIWCVLMTHPDVVALDNLFDHYYVF